MQKRKNIDMLRFYGGDVRERTDDGVLIDTCKDDLWSDKTAYRTLNALLFDGYENEKERIFKEGNKLNPVFVRRLKDTIKIYTGIFKLMCMEKQKKVGKYLIQPGSFPDYREIIKSSKEELYQRILQGKEEASLCLERMNAGDWCSDYRIYENWKKDFQDYLKLLYSDLWYENGDIKED